MSKFVNINGAYYNTDYFFSVEFVPLPDKLYGLEIKTTRKYENGYNIIRSEPTSMERAQKMLDKIIGVD